MQNFSINSLVELEESFVLDRPRVSYQIRDYIWAYIYKNILEPRNILCSKKYTFRLTLDLNKFDPDIHRFFTDSPYNGEENKFRPEPSFRIFEKTTKAASIRILSTYCDKNISPNDYANLIYDGFGSFLINISKTLTKEVMDSYKADLDYNYINSFEFPAPFDQQQYIGDNSEIDNVLVKEIYKNGS